MEYQENGIYYVNLRRPDRSELPIPSYGFVADCLLEMDKINAIAASRMAEPYTQWRLYDEKRGAALKAELQRMLDAKPSPNLYEICTKSLV